MKRILTFTTTKRSGSFDANVRSYTPVPKVRKMDVGVGKESFKAIKL